MRKLVFLLLVAPIVLYSQTDYCANRLAEGTATDQDGNTFEFIKYGALDWAIGNGEPVTYRDGTQIPQVSYSQLYRNYAQVLGGENGTFGSWCYEYDDPDNPKIYNGYAILGIYDEASLNDASLRKEFAPEGWRVPSNEDWSNLENQIGLNNGQINISVLSEKFGGYDCYANNSGFNVSLIVGYASFWTNTLSDEGYNDNFLKIRWFFSNGNFFNSGWVYVDSRTELKKFAYDRFDVFNSVRFVRNTPDDDGDGLRNDDDRCPYDIGIISNQGCPDSDGDGVVDIDDQCPNLSGIKENNGCPYECNTFTDQDGNIVDCINYGSYDWSVENAQMVTYRDGTPIPEVIDTNEWNNLKSGAWCYMSNDSSLKNRGKLYNWYAIMGIHDEASLNDASLRKEFAPEGWRVPSNEDWSNLESFLISNGYNYDNTTTGNKIAKAMAARPSDYPQGLYGWHTSNKVGTPANEPNTNNSSGFNLFPTMYRAQSVFFGSFCAYIWSNTYGSPGSNEAWQYYICGSGHSLESYKVHPSNGNTVRLVRDIQTLSKNKYSNKKLTIYPNPTTSILTIEGDKEYYVEVYDMAGNKVMALTGNSINMEHLSKATYIVKATDKSNNEELTYKVVKN